MLESRPHGSDGRRFSGGPGFVAIALLTALVACAGNPPPPTAQMAVARSALDEASRSGAAERASQDYAISRDKLARAEEAMKDGDNTDARRLADEATIDAQLATIRSNTAAETAAQNPASQGSTVPKPAPKHQPAPH